MAQTEVSDQDAYPFSSVVYVEATFPNGETYTGSGVMVGANDVLTATHVVYGLADGGAATEVVVTPGYDPILGAPFGAVEATSWNYLPGADPDGDGRMTSGDGGPGLAEAELDVALIDLSVPLGLETGWMELDPTFEAGVVNVTGHPVVHGSDMMNDAGHVEADPVDWTIDTEGLEVHPGNSGGPLWHASGGEAQVVGVVSTAGAAAHVGGTYDLLVDAMAANDALLAAA